MKSKIVGDRIKTFMAKQKINQSHLAIESGIPQSNISAMLLGKRDLDRLVDYLEDKYGMEEGSFYKDLDSQPEKTAIDMRRHFISHAKAGMLTAEQGSDYEMQPVISQFPKYDYTIEVRGDSMAPTYKAGDIVACLDVTRSSFLQWGNIHILNTSQGVVMKKVYEEGDFVKCVSINSEEFPDFRIPKVEIYSIGLVVGTLRIGN